MSFAKQKISTILLALIGLQWTGALAAPAPGGQRSPSVRWAYQLQRAVAHQRMKNTMYASTPSSPANGPMCPALVNLGRSRPVAVDLRGSFSVTDESLSDDDKAKAALDFFLKHISGPVVQAKCVNCHVEGGVSGHTRLVFQPSSTPDHGAKNLEAIRKLLSTVEDGAERILNKIQGVGHGGGVQVAAGSADFANMERLLELLGYGDGSGTDLTPETLFDTVTMASPGKTLRRAALIFGGEIPTREEREAVDNGTEKDLRAAIRKLMTGPGFHEFLIRGSNDRLLTDRGGLELTHLLVDLANINYRMRKAAFNSGEVDAEGVPTEENLDFANWGEHFFHGFERAPLELIAHVVENDLPYTEILTADYIMANPRAAEAYGASTRFDDSEDPLEFRPSQIVSYYREGESMIHEYDTVIGAARVFDPGDLITDYPHAGVLNTTSFLYRYPTTPTNRNRARSRWTYYHFLGLDIEKSASRTTDPVALADTDNPTMNNPACTVCHRVMDPVAGTFQNYGEEGYYRDEWEGLDSLDEFYKYPPDGSYTPYRYGDSWYRGMREPGFDGEVAPNSEKSLQWLAERIVADDRFAEAAVKFWWPAILGVEIAEPPEDRNDSDFEAMLLASNAQSAEVERLAEAFRTGIAGGKPYNLKDLLVEIVLSPWFRAESVEDDDPVRLSALRKAGVERLLTPEELAWKTQTITGYSWGRGGWEKSSRRWPGDYTHLTGFQRHLADGYRLLYGGIDSDSVTERADDMTAVMAAVAQSHAVEVSCPIVRREFLLWPEEKRRLFGGIDETVSPVWEGIEELFEVSALTWQDRQTISHEVSLDAGTKTIRLQYVNPIRDFSDGRDRIIILDRLRVRSSDGSFLKTVEFRNLPKESCGSPWGDRGYDLWAECPLGIPMEFPFDGSYVIDVIAFQHRMKDLGTSLLEIAIESDIETSRGAKAIRNKLVELYEQFLGVTVTADSPEVEAAFQLFVEVWDRERNDSYGVACQYSDRLFFEGVADDVLRHDGNSYPEFNWERVDEILEESNFHRSDPVLDTWTVVLAYILTDYRYLFL